MNNVRGKMDLFLSLAAKVSNDYGFSALAVALLMVLFYWIVEVAPVV